MISPTRDILHSKQDIKQLLIICPSLLWIRSIDYYNLVYFLFRVVNYNHNNNTNHYNSLINILHYHRLSRLLVLLICLLLLFLASLMLCVVIRVITILHNRDFLRSVFAIIFTCSCVATFDTCFS